ncbi:MAG: PAS domain S-box protein [Halothece sp. Uz-M2-17]|nr:PAS domain S-box protein [Halothece sp. Uz-M2-17]
MSSFPHSGEIDFSQDDLQQRRIAELEQENQQLHEELITFQQSEQQFRKIFNASNDAIFVIDPQADQILEANPQAEKLLGYSHEELLHSVSISSIHPEEMPKLIAFSREILTSGQGWTNQLTCLTKSGEKRPAEISATVVKFNSRPCIVALVRDISQRLKAQQEAMQATAALAELGELASMIVHEIRNPLTTVLMGLDALKQVNLPSREQMRLQLALEEAQRLQSLLEEIRLYAKPQIIEGEKVDLYALAAEVVTTLGHQFAVEDPIQVLSSSHSIAIWGDRAKLKQVLINLLANALEASNSSPLVTCQLISQEHAVLVKVHNDGNPIPPHLLSQLTQPFFTTKSSGSGLGLAIVKRIVESHQGEFLITSNPTDGTTVTLKFPPAEYSG